MENKVPKTKEELDLIISSRLQKKSKFKALILEGKSDSEAASLAGISLVHVQVS